MPWLSPIEAETITAMAANNLALRSGRTAAPDMLRTFSVEGHDIDLFEPSWTGDSIGYKTWAASLLLARRLPSLHTISTSRILDPCESGKCLGLGEGTGLLGIAAVKTMKWNVTLTDLPFITSNLRRNVECNCSERAEVRELDWSNPPSEDIIAPGASDVVIGSDLFYDSGHPGMVVSMIERYLRRASEARAVIGYPLRTSHEREIKDFEEKMQSAFELEASGEDVGVEDWGAEVICRWNIYKWKIDV
jgi:D-xylulose reductase